MEWDRCTGKHKRTTSLLGICATAMPFALSAQPIELNCAFPVLGQQTVIANFHTDELLSMDTSATGLTPVRVSTRFNAATENGFNLYRTGMVQGAVLASLELSSASSPISGYSVDLSDGVIDNNNDGFCMAGTTGLPLAGTQPPQLLGATLQLTTVRPDGTPGLTPMQAFTATCEPSAGPVTIVPDSADPAELVIDLIASRQPDFAEILVGQRAVERVVVSNKGDSPVAISELSLPPGFSMVEDCSGVLDPCEACDVTITFKPESAAFYDGPLQVIDTSGIPLLEIPLTGSGTVRTVAQSLPLDGAVSFTTGTSTTPVTGVGEFDLNVGTEAISATIELSPLEGQFESLWGSLPTTANVRMEQAGTASGTLQDSILDLTVPMTATFTKINASLFGLDINMGGSERCQTTTEFPLHLQSSAGTPFLLNEFNESGGILQGSFSFSELSNCGTLTSLFNAFFTGNPDQMQLSLGTAVTAAK